MVALAQLPAAARQRHDARLADLHVGDIVVGDAKAGDAYFTRRGRLCDVSHRTTRSLAGIASRLAPVDLQQRMLFPVRRRAAAAVAARRAAARAPLAESERRHRDA